MQRVAPRAAKSRALLPLARYFILGMNDHVKNRARLTSDRGYVVSRTNMGKGGERNMQGRGWKTIVSNLISIMRSADNEMK